MRCRRALDVAYLIDCNLAVSENRWNVVLETVNSVSAQLCHATAGHVTTGTRFARVDFGDTAHVVQRLNDTSATSGIVKRVTDTFERYRTHK